MNFQSEKKITPLKVLDQKPLKHEILKTFCVFSLCFLKQTYGKNGSFYIFHTTFSRYFFNEQDVLWHVWVKGGGSGLQLLFLHIQKLASLAFFTSLNHRLDLTIVSRRTLWPNFDQMEEVFSQGGRCERRISSSTQPFFHVPTTTFSHFYFDGISTTREI